MPAVDRQDPHVVKILNRLNVNRITQTVDLCKPCHDWFLYGQHAVAHADYSKKPPRFCGVR